MSYRLLQGDALDVLETLEPQSVHCVVTSPPYFGLRDYGEAGQLGLESTPEEYVARMVAVFAAVGRVLRDDGTLWLNLGDSYAGYWGEKYAHRPFGKDRTADATTPPNKPSLDFSGGTIKPKDLVGIPWRVAFALQAAGWYLRSDIIWAKVNPMPESVTDRPTKAHEYVFLLTKRPKYYYDATAIKEGVVASTLADSRGNGNGHRRERGYPGSPSNGGTLLGGQTGTRNKRTVWTIATEPYPEAHFATYPTALVKPCVLAGTSARGVCAACGRPWERVVETKHPPLREVRTAGPVGGHGLLGTKRFDDPIAVTTTGWRAGCGCDAGEPVPATVLDPFCGSGTTGLVALTYGRNFVGIDLSADYLALAEKRIAPVAAQGVLL